MDYTLEQINDIIGGELADGGDTRITGVASVEEAVLGDITFIKGEPLVNKALASRASAVVTHRRIDALSIPSIVAQEPFAAFIKFLEVISDNAGRRPKSIHPSSVIADTARLGNDISIAPGVVIDDDVVLGDNVTIYPNTYVGRACVVGACTTIYANVSVLGDTTIGRRVIIHSGTVIGSDGFGYLQRNGKHAKIPQVGAVEIGDDVEIGANVTIDRAALDKTVIGNGVKIDNHSHIAHNVVIGDDSMLIAYAKVAGGTRIGRNVMIAEDVGITDNIVIGDGAIVGASSGIYKSLRPGAVVWGSPAKPLNDEKRIQSIIKKLPEMRRRIREIEKILASGD